MSKIVLIKNAFANVCRGSSAALVMILMPPFLTKILAKDSYSTWLLILQLSTYVTVLDFGIQTAVGRFIAYYNELTDFKSRDSIVSSAFAISCVLSLIGMVGVILTSLYLPTFFPEMPTTLQQSAQYSLMIVGISLCILLPLNTFGAVFIGLQRYDVPAWASGISKIFGGVATIIVAYKSKSIIIMAVMMGIFNLMNGVWLYFAYKKLAKQIVVSYKKVSKVSIVSLFSYCSGLVVWSMGMILVNGLDTTIIGYFEYKSVVYYTLAATITNFLTGFQSSIFATLLPAAAVISASGNKKELGGLLSVSTRYAVIMLTVTSLPIFLFGDEILTAWVGKAYANESLLLLNLLVIANFLRQIGAPYAIVAIAAGEQKRIIISPVVEGVTNLLISIFLVQRIGVIGVAIGTIVGGAVSLAFHTLYNLPRSEKIQFNNRQGIFSKEVIKPFLALLPLILIFPYSKEIIYSFFNGKQLYLVELLCFTSVLLVLLLIVLTNKERRDLIMFVKLKAIACLKLVT